MVSTCNREAYAMMKHTLNTLALILFLAAVFALVVLVVTACSAPEPYDPNCEIHTGTEIVFLPCMSVWP